jgi:hypothetical protein
MDRAPGSKPATPRAPEHLRWDVDNMETHRCTLATARAGAGDVVLNFGERQPRGDQAAELAAALARRVTLSPLTARNLAATLRRLIDENDGGAA